MKKLFILLIVSLPMISACNTIAGAGEDIQAGGKVITEAADNVKNQL